MQVLLALAGTLVRGVFSIDERRDGEEAGQGWAGGWRLAEEAGRSACFVPMARARATLRHNATPREQADISELCSQATTRLVRPRYCLPTTCGLRPTACPPRHA